MGKWKTTYNKTRIYNKEWELNYPWLSFSDGICYCNWCECKLSSMRKSNFDQHEKTSKHLKALFDPTANSSGKSLGEEMDQPHDTIEYKDLCPIVEEEVETEYEVTATPMKGVEFIQAHPDVGHEDLRGHDDTPISYIISNPGCEDSSSEGQTYTFCAPDSPQKITIKEDGGAPKRKRTKEEDICDSFGSYVASQLKKLPLKNMLEAQTKIQHLLIQQRLSLLHPSVKIKHELFS